MEREFLDMFMSHLAKLEEALKEDIREIKEDLKTVKEIQVKLAEVIVKLSAVEEKYNAQFSLYKETRVEMEDIKNTLAEFEKKVIPVMTFFKDFTYLRRKIFAGVGVALILGLATLVINILKWMG